jgi:hypothetical protein
MKLSLKLGVVMVGSLLPFASAQTCEDILAGVEATSAEAAEVVRTVVMRLGEREVARSTSRVTQGENGLEVTVLEQTGQQPPAGAPRLGMGNGGAPPEETLLGIPGSLSCEGHTLAETEEGYRLVLAETDLETPIESAELTVQRLGERLAPLSYVAQGTARQLIFSSAITMSISYGNWTFE